MNSVLLDCRPGGAWTQGHFEGALDADLDRFLSTASDPGFDPTAEGRHPLPPLDCWAQQLGLWGIDPDTAVVAYDGTRGEMGACRLWWMLRASGHEKVSLLEGGIEAGKAEGRLWTTDPGKPPVPRGPYPVSQWSWPIIDAEEAGHRAGQRRLLDVRSPERWRGEVEPIDPVAGRIPGSVNLFLGQNFDAAGRFRLGEELQNLYAPLLAGSPPSQWAIHCGSGVSACATLYAWDKAGLQGAALYVGSYSQWCRTRPVVRGRE